jgi:hypothetical protein
MRKVRAIIIPAFLLLGVAAPVMAAPVMAAASVQASGTSSPKMFYHG